MNIKRFVISVLAVFAFVFVFDWFFHSYFLANDYMLTANVWRPKAVMEQFFPIMLLSQFAFAFMVSLIFTLNYEGRGIGEGLRFGIFVGLLVGVIMFSFYSYIPIPFALAASWFFGAVVQCVGMGVVLALTYRR